MITYYSGMFRCAVNGVRMHTAAALDMMLSFAYLQDNPAGQDQLGTLRKIEEERMNLFPADLFRTPEQRLLSRKYVILVGCGKTKLPHPAQAQDLYTGGLTRSCIAWAKKNSSRWFILSAKYGLVGPKRLLPPYNVKMSDHNRYDKLEWGREQRERLEAKGLLEDTKFVALCGKDYLSALKLPESNTVYAPMEGLTVGKRLAWLKAHPVLTKELVRSMPRV